MRRQTTGRVVYPRIHTACPMLIDRGLSRPELRRFASPRQSGPTHSNGRSDFRHRDDTVSASDRSSLSKTPPMHNPHGNRYGGTVPRNRKHVAKPNCLLPNMLPADAGTDCTVRQARLVACIGEKGSAFASIAYVLPRRRGRGGSSAKRSARDQPPP
jgi:hypothetical protein